MYSVFTYWMIIITTIIIILKGRFCIYLISADGSSSNCMRMCSFSIKPFCFWVFPQYFIPCLPFFVLLTTTLPSTSKYRTQFIQSFSSFFFHIANTTKSTCPYYFFHVSNFKSTCHLTFLSVPQSNIEYPLHSLIFSILLSLDTIFNISSFFTIKKHTSLIAHDNSW